MQQLQRCAFVYSLAMTMLGSSQAQQAGPQDAPLSDTQFRSCLAELAASTSAAQRPILRRDFERIVSEASYQDRVRTSAKAQKEEPTLIWDDLATVTDEQRVTDGKQVIERAAPILAQIETRWRVPKEVIVALYGVETDYGPRQGTVPVLDAALSRACLNPCPPSPPSPNAKCPLRERAFAAARVIRDKHVKPETFFGSWAAAFGRTQFVPDTFEELAVDFDGDGFKDVIDSEADAWASTANFLRKRGNWKPGLPMYIEVSVPESERSSFEGSTEFIRYPEAARAWRDWQRDGWVAVGDFDKSLATSIPASTQMHLVLPAGLPGPALLATANYTAVLGYNPRSPAYPIKVGLLARKLAGGHDFFTPWPTDDPGLSRAEVRALQAWLVDRGHQDVKVDGIPGKITRDAIEAERRKKNMPPGRRVGKLSVQLLMQ